MKIKMMWKIITGRETSMERAQRAIKGVRKRSKWLGERPFGDKHGYGGDDYNDSRYGSPQ